MELVVGELVAALITVIAALAAMPGGCFGGIEFFGCYCGGGETGRHRFEHRAQAVDLGEAGAGQQWHDRGAARTDIETLLRRKPAQAGPHRHEADLQGAGNAADRQGFTGREVAADQRLAQRAIDLFLEQR